MWGATSRRQHQIPTTAVRVGADTVTPTTSVRDLGIFIDSDLSMRTQVTRTVAGCFAVLRQLRSIRRSVLDPVFQSLVVSLVLTKLDYGNATLTGLPAYQYRRLQSVLNAAARQIYRRRRFDHVTSLLRELHWLKSSERVAYKLALTFYRCLHGLAPSYLALSVRRVAELDRRRLRSSSSDDVIIPTTRVVTVGDRAFTAAGSRLWNSLPPDIRSAQTLPVFCNRLKTYLFSKCFPTELYSHITPLMSYSVLAVLSDFGHNCYIQKPSVNHTKVWLQASGNYWFADSSQQQTVLSVVLQTFGE